MNEADALAFARAKEIEFAILMGSVDENTSDWDYLQGSYEAYGVMVAYLQGKLDEYRQRRDA